MVGQPATRWPAAFAALAIRDYRLLFQGNFATQIGFGMQQIAFGWLILELSNSPFYLGLNGFFFMIPMLVVSPFGGIIADRFPRKRVLIFSQTTLMMIAVALSALVFLKMVTIWQLMLASLLIGTIMSLNVPARQALMPELVGRDLLGNAIALHSMSLNASRIIGPALAGLLIKVVGIAGCFLFQAVGYVWSVSNVLAIKTKDTTSVAKGESPLHNLIEGFRYCYRTKTIFTMLLVASISSVFAMPSYMTLLPDYARETLGLGADGLGILLSAAGAGALVGSLGLAMARRLPKRGLIVLGAVGFTGVLLVLLSMARSILPAILVLGGIATCNSILMVLNQSIIQEIVPDRLRGRAMSAYIMTWGLMPLGALPLGGVAQAFGTPRAMLVSGTICVVLAAAMLVFRPDVRRI